MLGICSVKKGGTVNCAIYLCTYTERLAGMVAHPVTQVIGELAAVDILDLSKVY